MTRFRILWSTLLILALTAPSVRADDECILDEEKKATKATIAAALKAEKSGKAAELFVAYQSIEDHYCAHLFDKNEKNLQTRAKANLPKLGRDLAKTAEAKGLLYGKEPLGTDGKTSAFAWFEAIGEFNEANRVMLKVVHAKSDNLEFFKTAWEVDGGRRLYDPKTNDHIPYISPPAYRQELQKVASANAERFMKAEEKDAPGLSGGMQEVMKASMDSLEKLKKASDWMKFLPDGDKPAKARAEQRGDTIVKRNDPMFTQGFAKEYYNFAGSSKAKQLEAKMEESNRAMQKSGEKAKGAVTQKSEADQKKFNKEKADMEKELGF